MGRLYKYIGNYEAARGLWENKEALGKYLARLKELMMADPDSRMTENETPVAARIRAELFNVGLRGSELIDALKERLLSEGMSE
jgi:hypothetical protein